MLNKESLRVWIYFSDAEKGKKRMKKVWRAGAESK
jgi:hypothetical protein